MTIKAPETARIPELRKLWQEAFGDTDAFLDGFFADGWAPNRSRCLELDGEIAAALYWFDCCHAGRKIAYLYAVATAKAYQNRGLCHALMGDTHAHLQKLGYAGAVLVPAAGLFPFYEGMGYRVCSQIQKISCTAGETPVVLRALDAAVYARLRKRYLPRGGVLQEGENLTFLATFTRFYAGEDFLLCGEQVEEKFFCQELLGNAVAAPGILRALGCTQGNFRTPREGQPFAMYLPLDDTPAPAYFGLALD